jgi:hydrogenase/urease accessory protein HupE
MFSERRAAACAALALVGLWPGSALAHGLIPGANQFYVGLLHPLLAPAHVLALLTLGLALGRGGDSRRDPSVLTLILGLMAGALLSVPLGDPGTDAALLALAVGCALLTAGNRLGPRWVLAALAGAVGLAVGLGSGDPAFTPQQRWVTMGGSLVGALVLAKVVFSSAATRAFSACTASGPIFCRNGNSSHPPMPQAKPKLRTISVGPVSSPP